jgi:hypothetical protein
MQFYAKLLEKFLEPYLTYLGKLLYKENHVMANAKALGSIPASSDTVESEMRQIKQC